MKYCSKCGKEHLDEAVICVGCGCAFDNPAQKTQAPMKWYNFLIYFALFAVAFSSFASGVSHIVNAIFPKSSYLLMDPDIAEFFIVPKPIHIVYAILLFVLCALAIVTRQHLAKYKRSGPVLLYLLYILDFAFSTLYDAACYIAVQTADLTEYTIYPDYFSLGDFIVSVASLALLLSLNYTYFKKREFLFNK